MSNESTDACRAANLISSLGGPSLDSQELDRVNSLEAGKLLLAWLAAQVPQHDEPIGENDSGGDGIGGDQGEQKRRIYAAMRDSALEWDEVLILNQLKLSEPTSDAQSPQELPADYMPPSQLRKHADYANAEIDVVNRETEMLRSRIAQTKAAAKKITHSIKLLQKAVYDLNSRISGSDERLSELSITADTTITSTVNQCHGLLKDLGFSGLNVDRQEAEISEIPEKPAVDKDPELMSARSLLFNAKRNISMHTADLQESMRDLSLLRQEEPARIADLQMEAERLQKAFDDIHSEEGQTEEGDGIMIEELGRICDLLEHEAALRDASNTYESDTLNNLLSELEGGIAVEEDKDINVRKILQHAWARDQAAILRLHEAALDQALSSLDSTLEPLELVYAALSRLARSIQEAEVLLEAFIEELEEIHLHQPQEDGQTNAISDDDVRLEKELTDELNKHKDLRPSDAAPLLILDQEDIIAELRSLKARSSTVEASERKWVHDMLQEYSNRPVDPALPHIYSNSPLNTCPPFAFPAYVRDLETQARQKVAELQHLASSLEEEVHGTFAKESNKKRLTAFVDKWCRTD